MPRKPATATTNGKAATASTVITEPAQTGERLAELEAEVKATQVKPAQAKTQVKAAQPIEPAQPVIMPARSLNQRLDDFLDSRTGRLFQTVGTVFLLTLPAYSFGYSDGLLKGLTQTQAQRSIEPAATVPTVSPSPVAPAK